MRARKFKFLCFFGWFFFVLFLILHILYICNLLTILKKWLDETNRHTPYLEVIKIITIPTAAD